MARIITRLRQCLIRMVGKPFGFIVAANDYANLIFAGFLLFGAANVPGTEFYTYLASQANLYVWPGLIILSVILSRWGFWKRNAALVGWAAMLSTTSWMFALLVYIQLGSLWAGLPFVLRPIAIATFTKLKVTLDKQWYDK
jgi:hypothetical protein